MADWDIIWNNIINHLNMGPLFISTKFFSTAHGPMATQCVPQSRCCYYPSTLPAAFLSQVWRFGYCDGQLVVCEAHPGAAPLRSGGVQPVLRCERCGGNFPVLSWSRCGKGNRSKKFGTGGGPPPPPPHTTPSHHQLPSPNPPQLHILENNLKGPVLFLMFFFE